MVKVSIEVRNGAARFDVAVQAESIQRALSFVGERYPDGNIRVKFPSDAEGFFVKDTADQRQIVGYEQAGGIAA
ncbi:MAG: hypothetical protein ACJ73W_03035 [Rubrobacteraceae bacterium]